MIQYGMVLYGTPFVLSSHCFYVFCPACIDAYTPGLCPSSTLKAAYPLQFLSKKEKQSKTRKKMIGKRLQITATCMAVAFLVVAATAQTSPGQQLPSYPLCSTTKGFASDINSEFVLNVPMVLREREAIVLVIRPAPFVPGLTWISARLNATYKVLGSDVFALSNSNGILQITDQVEQDTEIRVKIINLRPDASTPFVFYSYHSGYRSCSLDVSPTASFTGPVPTHIDHSNTVASVYLKSAPPKDATSFRVVAFGTISLTYSEGDPHSDGNGVGLNMDMPISSTASVLYFTLRPGNQVTETQMVHVSITYATTPTQGVEPPPNPPVVLPPSGEVGAPVPSGSGPAPSSASTNAAEASGSVLSVVIVIVLVYFAGRSIYNYRVKQITAFPEFVPHHEVFSSVATFCGTAAKHMRDKGRTAMHSRSGYGDVNRDEMYEAS